MALRGWRRRGAGASPAPARAPGLVLAVALVWAAGCGQGDSQGGSGRATQGAASPPIITEVRIAPEQPLAVSPITAHVRTSDPMGQRVDVEYQWLHQGVEIPSATGQTLSFPDVKRGDEIAVRVTPIARGLRGTPVTSPSVTLLNSPPVLARLTISPREVRRHDTLKVEAEARDPDRDRILFTYQWFRNGEEIAGATGPTLVAKDVRKGDRITVRVTVSDLEATSAPLESPPVLILNSPPRVVADPRWETAPDGTIIYHLAAEDPDGDAMTFTLSNAPKGMAIDGRLGIIRFRPEPGDAGIHRFGVTINDGDGAAVQQNIVLTIREQ